MSRKNTDLGENCHGVAGKLKWSNIVKGWALIANGDFYGFYKSKRNARFSFLFIKKEEKKQMQRK